MILRLEDISGPDSEPLHQRLAPPLLFDGQGTSTRLRRPLGEVRTRGGAEEHSMVPRSRDQAISKMLPERIIACAMARTTAVARAASLILWSATRSLESDDEGRTSVAWISAVVRGKASYVGGMPRLPFALSL